MRNRRTFLKWAGATGLMAPLAHFSTGAAQPALRRPGFVQTVLGPVDASKLGVTLPHEHIADGSDVLARWPKAWGGRTGLVDRAVQKLQQVKASGINTIVDLTPYDVGRDIRFLEEVSRKSGLNMIACTGQRFFPPQDAHVSMPSRTIAGLTEFFVKEIEQGIDGTGIRAAVIKLGVISGRPTELEEIGLRAAARASKATGVPIRTHTNAAERAGESHAAILEDEGVNPARVSFDHSDTGGMDYFLGLVKRGYSLGMDHVHRGAPDALPTFERRAECIKLLTDAGFAGKVFLSQDVEFGGALLPLDLRNWRENIDPAEDVLFVTQRLVPYLRKMGVSERDIHTMTVENSRSFFAQV